MDKPAIVVHCFFNIRDTSWIFIVILIIFPFLFDLRFICLWWSACSSPSPLNEGIKVISFLDLNRTVDLCNIE